MLCVSVVSQKPRVFSEVEWIFEIHFWWGKIPVNEVDVVSKFGTASYETFLHISLLSLSTILDIGWSELKLDQAFYSWCDIIHFMIYKLMNQTSWLLNLKRWYKSLCVLLAAITENAEANRTKSLREYVMAYTCIII